MSRLVAQRRRVEAFAARQDWVVSLAQLYGLGLSFEDVRELVRHGNLHRIHRGVYAVGRRTLSPRGQLRAALLTFGAGSFLSHRTAAAERGLRALDLAAIEVTVPGQRTPRRPGLIVHRTSRTLDRLEVNVRHGLLVATVPRLLVELAPRETPIELERIVTQAVRKDLFRPKDVAAVIDRHPHGNGIAVLRAAVSRYTRLDDRSSDLERSFDAYATADRRIPPYERNVELGGWEIDCLWRRERLALELDGRSYHVAMREFDRDRIKDTQVQLMGYRVMRVSDFRWEHDRAAVIDQLLAMLALAHARP
jgi:very-short-patch-repair endonuclease